ncbi:hypothetical protein [Marinibacterium sp. SX1]|uniref:hypothetical protein n=1 Tax=Marinibacterium sp. SX1 TaxID=3388424 RepID=UPI003D17A2CE
MTDESGKPVRPRQWALQRLANKALDWAVLGVLAVLVGLFVEPVQKRAVAVWNTPTVMESIRADLEVQSDRIDVVATEIRRLKQPTAVFEMSTYNTGPIAGFCVESMPCEINVRIRRLVEALPCDIVKGSVQWGFINPRADTFVQARRMDHASGRNIGSNWEDITIVLMTPPNLEPEAYFTFEAFYTGCPGMADSDDPISFNSPRDLFKIRARGTE